MSSPDRLERWTASARRRIDGIPRLSLIVAAVAVIVDQISKEWAVSHLADGHADHIVWTLRFNLSFNSGMAFGRAQGWGPVIAVVATLVIIGFVLTLKNSDGHLSTIAVGSIVGGALGNLLDRLFRNDAWLHGRVVDFIDFQWFPIFNMADVCINLGGALLVLGYFRAARRATGRRAS